MRMLMNNLDPAVAERPEDLIVYGGSGRAARSWEAFDAIGVVPCFPVSWLTSLAPMARPETNGAPGAHRRERYR